MPFRYATIARFPDYRFGTDGSVWTCRRSRRYFRRTGWRKLKSTNNNWGYPLICLYPGTENERLYLVSRLILEAFRGPAPPGMEACHRNRITADVRLTNLRWGTKKSNEADKKRHGTDNRGSRNGQAKLTEKDVEEIWADLAAGKSQTAIARRKKVSPSQISNIKHRKHWSHVEGGI